VGFGRHAGGRLAAATPSSFGMRSSIAPARGTESKSGWDRCNQKKIRNMTSYPELTCQFE
jgi:hypothetical protein